MKQIKRIITGMDSWLALTLMVQKRFEKKSQPFAVIIKPAPKTHEQLGYLHTEVLSKLALALFEAGEIETNSEREAKYYLKVQIGYGVWFNFRGGVVFDAHSFEKATTEELSKAINEACHICEQYGIYVNPPKERK